MSEDIELTDKEWNRLLEIMNEQEKVTCPKKRCCCRDFNKNARSYSPSQEIADLRIMASGAEKCILRGEIDEALVLILEYLEEKTPKG